MGTKYRVRTAVHGWLDQVDGYGPSWDCGAGVIGHPITGLAINVNSFFAQGSYHGTYNAIIERWGQTDFALGYVNGYDINNYANDWAGQNPAARIKGISAYVFTNSSFTTVVPFQVHILNSGWSQWIYSCHYLDAVIDAIRFNY